jgi:Tol biopolymer transport system component/uncharacterized protein YjdB
MLASTNRPSTNRLAVVHIVAELERAAAPRAVIGPRRYARPTWWSSTGDAWRAHVQRHSVAGRPALAQSIRLAIAASQLTRLRPTGVLLALLLPVLACSDSSEPTGGATPVASVQVTPTERTLAVGQSMTLSATPRAADGSPLSGRPVAWESLDQALATVSAQGLVEAKSEGQVAIVARSGGKEGRATITVTPAPVASVDVESVSLEEGESRPLVATPKDAAGRPLAGRAVQWSSSDPSVALVSPAGLVIALRVGAATVTATAEGVSGVADVEVSLTTAYDLVFDGSSARAGGVVAPRLYTLDIRHAGAAAQPVFSVDGYTSDPTPSPDGTRIAFVAADGGSSNIYVANRDGTDIRQLTSTPEGEDQPAWSPDATKIAFRRWAAGGPPGVFNPADVWVMSADGSAQVNLTDEAGDAGSQQAPAWSLQLPDGSYRIAFASETRGPDGYVRARIYSMRADGEDKQVVTESGDAYDDQPAWSPDGSAIVFTRTGPAHDHQLLVVSLATGSERALMALDPAGPQHAPAWSPDGRLVAFVSNHEIDADGTYENQVYTVRADGTGLARRTFDDTEKQNPSWIRR